MIHRHVHQGGTLCATPRWMRRCRLRACARLAALVVVGIWLIAVPPDVRAVASGGPAAVRANPAPAFFWHPEIAPVGPMVMVVSLDEQYLYVYRNGVAIGASPISSGRPGRETPTGIYTILQKEREHRSNLYDDAPMPFMQRLTWDGIAMHGGNLPGHPASHGCIRLPQSFAEKLYAVSQRNAVVVIAEAHVAPAAIVHPAAVAPIGLTGQPMATPQPGDQPFPGVPADGVPLSVVISIHDRAVYLLQDGQLVASSALGMTGSEAFRGTVLYVMRRDNPAADETEPLRQAGHLWSAYRIIGTGAVPEPAQMARQLNVPAAFAQRLQASLAPGTTVLVTDLPGYGRIGNAAYGALLESDQQPAATR